MIATIMQATGVAVAAIGVGLWFMPAGLVVAGVGMVLFGMAIERGTK
jgi:hypothetical protein